MLKGSDLTADTLKLSCEFNQILACAVYALAMT
jgi:hypothetical protein